MSTAADWQLVTPHRCALGESPFWHPQEQALYWVDIVGRQIWRVQPDTGTAEAWDLPSEPGCIAPAARGGWVMALRSGVFRAKTWAGELTHLATLGYDPTHQRANDGKCDALGRFWVGTIDETKLVHNAALYLLDCRSGTTRVTRQTNSATQPLTTVNGLAWSPDNRTMYWADTPSHTVYACDFDLDQARMTGHRRWVNFNAKPVGWQFAPAEGDCIGGTNDSNSNGGYRGRPDGAAVDVQGNYFVALYEGRRLCKFAPDGQLLAEWPTPAQCPTMPCFGGKDLKTLFITTARHGRGADELSRFTHSGGIFSMWVDVPGLPANCFVD